jgi:glutamine amidotransferase
MIYIVDYGIGNLGSIENIILRTGGEVRISSNPTEIEKATKLILPGVGNFDYGMKKLNESGLNELIEQKALKEKIPTLGICLGAQMMCKSSEEGIEPGLGWFDANVKKFDFLDNAQLRVPHMGWNFVKTKKDSLITKDLAENSRFYFVHSYHMLPNVKEDLLFETSYGYNFASGLQRDNLYALQFHPEKSHSFGKQIFKNFINL